MKPRKALTAILTLLIPPTLSITAVHAGHPDLPSKTYEVDGGSIVIQGGVIKDLEPRPFSSGMPYGKLRFPTEYFLYLDNKTNQPIWAVVKFHLPKKVTKVASRRIDPGKGGRFRRTAFDVIVEKRIPIKISIYEDEDHVRSLASLETYFLFEKPDRDVFRKLSKTEASEEHVPMISGLDEVDDEPSKDEQRSSQDEPQAMSSPVEVAQRLVIAYEAAERGQGSTAPLPEDFDVKLQRAADDLESYLADHPEDVTALILTARVRRIQVLIEPVVWSPDEELPVTDLGPAHERLDRALAMEPDNAAAHFWHGRLYGIRRPVVVDDLLWERAINLEQAIEHAERAVELAPRNREYREALAVFLLDAERYEDAEDVVRDLDDGRHMIHLLLTDMAALDLPPSAIYSRSKTEGLVSFQESMGRYEDISYPGLRVRIYIMPGPVSELEEFLGRRWNDIKLFKLNTEKGDGVVLRQYGQFLRRDNGDLYPTKSRKELPEDDIDGLLLSVLELKNPSEEVLEDFGLDPVESFCTINVLNFRGEE